MVVEYRIKFEADGVTIRQRVDVNPVGDKGSGIDEHADPDGRGIDEHADPDGRGIDEHADPDGRGPLGALATAGSGIRQKSLPKFYPGPKGLKKRGSSSVPIVILGTVIIGAKSQVGGE